MGRGFQRSMRMFPIDEMTDPRGKAMVQIYEDSWWAVSVDEELYFYSTEYSPYLSPQCNRDRRVAEAVCTKGLIKELGNFKELRQIPLVFVPIHISDYV